MQTDARVDLNVDVELLKLALELRHMAERDAGIIAEEIRGSIPDSDLPADAGDAPHSPGPYRDSWKHGKAKVKKGAVTAYAFSMATTSTGEEALANVLEEGRGSINPHPHWRAALERARRRIAQLLSDDNASMRGRA